jgi:hypothetical protein
VEQLLTKLNTSPETAAAELMKCTLESEMAAKVQKLIDHGIIQVISQ